MPNSIACIFRSTYLILVFAYVTNTCVRVQLHESHQYFLQVWDHLLEKMAILESEALAKEDGSQVNDPSKPRAVRRGAVVSLHLLPHQQLQLNKMVAALEKSQLAAVEFEKAAQIAKSGAGSEGVKPVEVYASDECTVNIMMFGASQLKRCRLRNHRNQMARKIAVKKKSAQLKVSYHLNEPVVCARIF